MSKNRILTIEQIKESENQFICKNSEEQLLNIAGEKIAIFLLNKFKRKTLLFVCGKGNNGQDGIKFGRKFPERTRSNDIENKSESWLELLNLV